MASGLHAKLEIQRVLILHSNCWVSIVGIFAAACIIGFVTYPQMPTKIFWIWFISTLCVIPARFWIRRQFTKVIKNDQVSLRKALIWEKKWVLSGLMPSLIILSALFFPYESNQLVIYLFIALIMVSMVSGSIISSVTSKKTFMLFMNSTVPPFIAVCLFKSDGSFYALAAVLIIFYGTFSVLSLRINKAIIRSIKVQLDQQEMVDRDSLTNLWNRRKLFNTIESLKDIRYSVLLIDVDNFKALNDQYGHSKGDEILIQIAKSIKLSIRKEDLVVRYGGEEFLIVLFEEAIENAKNIAEKVRLSITKNCDVTVSIGVATTEQSQDFDTVVELADRAMYEAKKQGKNRSQISCF